MRRLLAEQKPDVVLMDLHLPPNQMPEIEIHLVHHAITLEGKTYFSGLDIQPEELQKMLMATSSFPTTSQPSAGDFSALYKKLAGTDPEILSIHMSSGLSGTVNAAHAGAEMTPEAHVTIVDELTRALPALKAAVAALALVPLGGWQNGLGLLTLLPLGLLLYAVVLLVTGTFGEEERAILRALRSRP